MTQDLLSGEIFEEYAVLSVDDLSRLCAVEHSYIVELVDEGVLSTMEQNSSEWRFTGTALKRARTALRLQRELEINLPGVALVLDLLQELEESRRALRRLERA